MVAVLFAGATFLAAALLFSVQPMFARMALPMLGGTPAVWTTCMLFFQTTLLAGYGYAHVTTRALSARRQAALHTALLLLPLLVLPVALPAGWAPPADQNPVPWLLACLAIGLGLPFFVVSATAPLLQKWFVHAGHATGRDPYVLYAASNLGSLAALLAYPLIIEPRLRLAEQSGLWTAGYVLLASLLAVCAGALWRAAGHAGAPLHGHTLPSSEAAAATGRAARPSLRQRFRWLALSLVPSSLVLGLTTHLTVDISPIPMLWLGPLAIYLLTFVLVFSPRPLVSPILMVRMLPVCTVLLLMVMSARAAGPLWLLVTLHVVTFFVAAMVCHGELARSRPPAGALTTFYLWIAAGGALGGVFNALIAPLAFRGVVEYPLALILACLLRPTIARDHPDSSPRWLTLAVPLLIVALVPGLAWAMRALSAPDALSRVVVLGVPALICFAVRDRVVAFALSLTATLLASTTFLDEGGRVLHRERSFFGVYRVSLDAESRRRVLWSGTTAHGFQSVDPALAREPLAYYHRMGPLGQIFAALGEREGRGPVAVVGLGTGSMACYSAAGEDFTFFEIDPAVERIARDPRYFTFLSTCGPRVSVVLGDARRSLHRVPDRRYRLIVLDAFTSDAIPTHLLTRQAIQLYFRKLSSGGLVAFHISNRYIDLEPMLATLMSDGGLAGLVRHDLSIPAPDRLAGRTESSWVALARRPEDLASLRSAPGWHPLVVGRGGQPWSDDFSSMLRLIRWR